MPQTRRMTKGPIESAQPALLAELSQQTAAARTEAGLPNAPLATRMRPRTLDELVGQEHLLGPGTALRRAIEEDRVASMVLWGPPGSGKTTLAMLIGAMTHAHMVSVSGVSAGVADLRGAAEQARQLR